jgi:hypothetical protein
MPAKKSIYTLSTSTCDVFSRPVASSAELCFVSHLIGAINLNP